MAANMQQMQNVPLTSTPPAHWGGAPENENVHMAMQAQLVAPAQVQLIDSRVKAEQDGGSGAAMENNILHSLGSCFECCCVICAGCGLTPNLATVQQEHQGIVTKFGQLDRILPAGRHKYNIMSEKVTPISMMEQVIDVPHQMMMTQDNLTVQVDAVCYYKVEHAELAYFEVNNYEYAVMQLIQVTLRTVIGENTLAEVLSERQKLNMRVQELIDKGTDPWGLRVTRVEMKSIDIDPAMQRAMAAKTEATQEAEAKLIQAKAQRDSALILVEAAAKMEANPGAMTLQWFETLRIISTQGQNTTVIVPDSIDAPAAPKSQ